MFISALRVQRRREGANSSFPLRRRSNSGGQAGRWRPLGPGQRRVNSNPSMGGRHCRVNGPWLHCGLRFVSPVEVVVPEFAALGRYVKCPCRVKRPRGESLSRGAKCRSFRECGVWHGSGHLDLRANFASSGSHDRTTSWDSGVSRSGGKSRCSVPLCKFSVVEIVLTTVFRCAGAASQAVSPDGGDFLAPDSVGSSATPPWGGGTVE